MPVMPVKVIQSTRRVAIAVLLSLLAAPAVQVQSGPAYPSHEWPAPGGDWASTRYSTLSQITTANVTQLGGAWVVDLPGEQVTKAPIMVKDGRMFVTTSRGMILALDPGNVSGVERPDRGPCHLTDSAQSGHWMTGCDSR